MDMQNVSNLQIPEGAVRTIHDSSNRLIWGRLAYDTKYAGDTYQQTYSGKNLLVGNYGTSTQQGIGHSWNNVYVTLSGTTSSTYSNITSDINAVISPGTYTFSTDKVSQFRKYIRVRYNGANHDYYIGVGGTSFSFTIPNDATDIVIKLFYIGNLTSGMQISETFGLMLESGSSASPFEPYTAGPAPNPDYPQPIQVVTGAQTVTISDGVDSEDFTISLGSIELCKIGDYQDYIYNSDGDWYVHKAIDTQVVDTSNITARTTYSNLDYAVYSKSATSIFYGNYIEMEYPLLCTHATHFAPGNFNTTNNIGGVFMSPNTTNWWVGFAKNTSLDTMKSDLSGCKLYSPLATPTDTKITDATLVVQLDAIHEWLTRYGYSATVTGNLPIIINQTNL
jgi:hypothetical protein